MTYEEKVKEAETLRRSGRELDGLVPVKARVAKDVRAVFSLRLSPAELQEITSAAKELGMTTGDFVRSAAVSLARQATANKASAVSLEGLIRDLKKSVVEIEKAIQGRTPS